MIDKKKLKEKNFSNRNITLEYVYIAFIIIVIAIALIIGLNGCNSQIITIEQPFVLAVDKCYCQKKISDKIIIQNDSGFKYMLKDSENYKTITNDIEFDSIKIGSLLVANWYQNIILK